MHLGHSPQPPEFLKQLISVSVAYWDTEMGLSIDTLIPFMRPSSVKKAYFHMVAQESFTESPLRFQITDLGLKYSNLDGDVLVHFLRCFPPLEKFYYNNGGAIVGYSDSFHRRLGRL
jgi:hypothetical protein